MRLPGASAPSRIATSAAAASPLGRWIRVTERLGPELLPAPFAQEQEQAGGEERGAGEEVDQVDLLGPAPARGRAGEDGAAAVGRGDHA